MEACYHLTNIRDLLIGDLERLNKRLKDKLDTQTENDKFSIQKNIHRSEAEIRALEMAGAALTRS
jgi:hypothetical protein